LIVRLHVEQIQQIVDDPQDEDAAKGSDRPAYAAAQGASADHDRGDGVQFVTGPDIGLGDPQPGGQQDACDCGEEPGHDVRQQNVAPDVDAGQPGCFLVTAERHDGPADGGSIQEYPDDGIADQHDDDGNGNRADEAPAQKAAKGRVVRRLRRFGIDVDQTPESAHGRQGGNERWQPEAGNQGSIDDTRQQAGRERRQERRWEADLIRQTRCQDPGQGDDRTDRKVDASCQDDDQHAKAYQTVGHDLAKEVAEVPLGEEHICRACDDYGQYDETHQEAIVRPATVCLSGKPLADQGIYAALLRRLPNRTIGWHWRTLLSAGRLLLLRRRLPAGFPRWPPPL